MIWCLTLLWQFLIVNSNAFAYRILADTNPIDQAWLDKTRTEGKRYYDKYRDLFRRLEERAVIKSQQLPGDGARSVPFRGQVQRVWVAKLGDNILVERSREFDGDSKPQIMLQCENSKYAFSLSKQFPKSEYTLISYNPGKESQQLKNGLSSIHEMVLDAFGQALRAVDGREGTQLRELRWDESKHLLRIVTSIVVGKGDVSPQELWLDPVHEWRVVEYRRETKSAVFTSHITYGSVIEGLTLPSGFLDTSEYKPGVPLSSMQIIGHVQSVGLTQRTEDDFLLSAFGLPEPVDVPPPTRAVPRYMWFILSAVGFGGAAALFRYLARRKARLQASSI